MAEGEAQEPAATTEAAADSSEQGFRNRKLHNYPLVKVQVSHCYRYRSTHL